MAAPASAHIRAWERANARTGTTAAMRVAQALALLALLVAAAARTDPSAEVRRAPGGSSLCQIYKAACPSFRVPRHTQHLAPCSLLEICRQIKCLKLTGTLFLSVSTFRTSMRGILRQALALGLQPLSANISPASCSSFRRNPHYQVTRCL